MNKISKRCIKEATEHTVFQLILAAIVLCLMEWLFSKFEDTVPNFRKCLIWAIISAMGANIGVVTGYVLKKKAENMATLIFFYVVIIMVFEGISLIVSGNTVWGFSASIFFMCAFIPYKSRGNALRKMEENNSEIASI